MINASIVFVTDCTEKAVERQKYYFYCLNIKCDKKLYTMSREAEQTSVDFFMWQPLLNSIYKVIKKFLIYHKVYKVSL